MGGTSQFALSSSGHIQSLVNPPGNPRMTVATGEATDADPEQWLAKTTAVTGSWWEPWAEWAAARSGGRHPAPSSLGSSAHPAGRAGSRALRHGILSGRSPARTGWERDRDPGEVPGAGAGAGRERNGTERTTGSTSA